MLFDARGWEVSDEIRRRIEDCTDADQLGRWLRRAANAAALDEVFD